MSRRVPEGTSPRWAFMKVFNIPDWEDPERVYLRRLRVFQTPWFGLYLHKIMLPDGDRDLHDHPWSFASLVLKGGYTEEWCPSSTEARSNALFPNHHVAKTKDHKRGSLHFMWRGEFHRIRTLTRVPTWTLVFVGRRAHSWGFMTPEGFVDYKEYG